MKALFNTNTNCTFVLSLDTKASNAPPVDDGHPACV